MNSAGWAEDYENAYELFFIGKKLSVNGHAITA
jgi:hypothetical protein